MPLKTYRKVSGAIGAALLLFLLGATVAVVTSRREAGDAAWLSRGHDIQSEFSALAAAVTSAKSDVRSFLLTGDSTYLRHYAASLDSGDAILRRLQPLVADDTAQQHRVAMLGDVLRHRRQALAETIVLRERPARLLHDVGPVLRRGEGLSSRIDSLVTELNRAERVTLDARVEREGSDARVMVLVAMLLGLGAIGAAVVLRRSISRDLTGRARAEEALRASEAKFAGILSVASDAIITVDSRQAIIHFNRGAQEIFGYAEQEMLGQPLERLLPARFAGGHKAHVESFARAPETSRRMGERRPVFGRRKNGQDFPADVSISKLQTPAGYIFTAMVRDATERIRVERHEHSLAIAGTVLGASLDYEATLRAVANLAVPALGPWSILDLVEENEAGQRTLRRVASQHPHAPIRDALGAWEAIALDWDSPERSVDVLRTGLAEIVPDAGGEWLEGHVIDERQADVMRGVGLHSLIFVPLVRHDAVVGVLTVGSSAEHVFDEHDLSLARGLASRAADAIENARLLRRAQQASAARDRVLGVVSHDLRNPLSAVSMLARRIVDEPLTDDAERRTLGTDILSSVEWMHGLMRDLLDVAAIEAGRLRVETVRADTPAIVATAVSMFGAGAHEHGLTLESEVAECLPPVEADAGRVVQVLGNLIGNAVKFTHAGGTITVGAHAAPNEVVMWVRDTGRGIPADQVPRVFDRFWQVRRAEEGRGWGLGLAIAQGIVTAHGGRIWVESEVGRGTTFSFTLKSHQDAADLP